jgi:hypothetical protein
MFLACSSPDSKSGRFDSHPDLENQTSCGFLDAQRGVKHSSRGIVGQNRMISICRFRKADSLGSAPGKEKPESRAAQGAREVSSTSRRKVSGKTPISICRFKKKRTV